MSSTILKDIQKAKKYFYHIHKAYPLEIWLQSSEILDSIILEYKTKKVSWTINSKIEGMKWLIDPNINERFTLNKTSSIWEEDNE